LASSREQFAEYYRSGGPAHPFERLALVRLRWIAGAPKLGFTIEQLRDELLYGGGSLDLDAIWEVLHKMRVQRLGSSAGRQLNAKYSPGALSDLEGTVQLLQVTHATDAPQLRTPRLHEAIESLRRAGVLSPVEFNELMAAYQFLRRLINAQRMLRGSAQDLILPPEKSDELVHLARRMNYRPNDERGDAGSLLLSDFRRHTNAVRQFIRSRLGRDVP
jgi:glutamate-ammonia-ligase adenylyltransferase